MSLGTKDFLASRLTCRRPGGGQLLRADQRQADGLVRGSDGQSSDPGRAELSLAQAVLLGAERRADAGRLAAVRCVRRRLHRARQRRDLHHGARRAATRTPRSPISANAWLRPACRATAFWSARATRSVSDGRVEIGYISYQASTAPCGDWSTNLAYTAVEHDQSEFRLLGAAQYRRAGRRSARPDHAARHDTGRRHAPRRRLRQLQDRASPPAATLTPDQSGAVSDVSQVTEGRHGEVQSAGQRRGIRRRAARAARAAHLDRRLCRISRHRRSAAARRCRSPPRQGACHRAARRHRGCGRPFPRPGHAQSADRRNQAEGPGGAGRTRPAGRSLRSRRPR